MEIPDHVFGPVVTAATVAGADVEETRDARIVDAVGNVAAGLGRAEGVRQAAKLVSDLGPAPADIADALLRHADLMRQEFLASQHPDIQATAREYPVTDDPMGRFAEE